MTRKRYIWCAAVCAGLLSTACSGETSNSEEPHASEPPKAQALENAEAELFRATGLPDTAVGRAIFAYMKAAATPPADPAQQSLDKELDTLRKRAAEVMATLNETYSKLEETNFPARWNAVFIMSQLREVTALPALETIAKAQIPSERFERHDHWDGGSQAEELRIRATAAEGIATLARAGRPEAIGALRALIGKDVHAAVRSVATRAYLQTGDEIERRAELAQLLEPNEHWMFESGLASPLNARQAQPNPSTPLGRGAAPAPR